MLSAAGRGSSRVRSISPARPNKELASSSASTRRVRIPRLMTTTSSAVRAILLMRWLKRKRRSGLRRRGGPAAVPGAQPPLSTQIGGHRAASVYVRQFSPAEVVSSANDFRRQPRKDLPVVAVGVKPLGIVRTGQTRAPSRCGSSGPGSSTSIFAWRLNRRRPRHV